jgi:tetratricopeptide (TPR) repeat protein
MSKCIRCGSEIPDGIFVCPVCGIDVQLVPNYEMLDLDMMIRQSISEEKKAEQLEERREIRRKHDSKRRFLKRLCTIALIAIAAIGISIAVMTIRSTMTVSGDEFDTAFKDAQTMYEDGDYQNAYNAVNTALGYDEGSIEAQILKAKIAYFGLENKDEAISILRNIIADNDSQSDAYDVLLEIYAESGDYDNIADIMGEAPESIRSAFADYIVDQPVFSVDGGTFSEDVELVLTAGDGCEIYYSTESGADFDDYSLYSEPVKISDGETKLTAVAVNAKGIHSKAVSRTFNIIYDIPNTPVISTASGAYTGENNKVTIEPVEGCTVYYSVDSKPSASSSVYTGPVEMQEGKHFIYAIAVNERGTSSQIAAIWYEYTPEIEEPETTVPSGGDNDTPDTPSSGGNNRPTQRPTQTPTEEPTPPPTQEPTVPPTQEPTVPPTQEPTPPPTQEPTPDPGDDFTDQDAPSRAE